MTDFDRRMPLIVLAMFALTCAMAALTFYGG